MFFRNNCIVVSVRNRLKLPLGTNVGNVGATLVVAHGKHKDLNYPWATTRVAPTFFTLLLYQQ
jgi:hypothetical protein